MAKVLIANRGEITVRVARTLRELGLESVAVFSEADEGAPHTRVCDEALPVPTYLDIDAILDAAKKSGATLIHPGYGFLAERAEFAEACGRKFIGPSPKAIREMGDKNAARDTAESAGVPVIPGSKKVDAATVRKLGLPVMLKAAAGGGGKGMRRIEKEEGLEEQIESAQREAMAAFGDDTMFVEKVLTPARHVEVQIIADTKGNVFALGERECSMQRRFQKILEESPSPVVDPALRKEMQDSACSLAKAVGYVGAGTVEYLLQDGKFYFLEMNTRLQVEHPVTEFVTGVDLVRLQIEVAQGKKLSKPAGLRGHAIEARLYAENPDAGFLPTSGRILKLVWPEEARVDHALCEGLEIGGDFDPMLAKVIVYGPDREHARRRLVHALRDTVLLGLPTNLSWLIDLLETKEFRKGEMSTDRLPEIPDVELPVAVWAAAMTARAAGRSKSKSSPWESLGGWRIGV